MRSKDKRHMVHGTLEGYKAYGCRCQKCRDIWDMYTQEYRANVYDETKRAASPIDVHSKKEYIDMDKAYKEYRVKDYY